MPPYFLHIKRQENPPCPPLDQHFTYSLKIMTLPKKIDFWNVDTPKPENAEQNVQTDHLTGHATDQTFFTFSVEFFPHLSGLPLFTFSVEIVCTFTGPVIFHI